MLCTRSWLCPKRALFTLSGLCTKSWPCTTSALCTISPFFWCGWTNLLNLLVLEWILYDMGHIKVTSWFSYSTVMVLLAWRTVPSRCFLRDGTVPSWCFLHDGTVPSWYFLRDGTVPSPNHYHKVNSLTLFSHGAPLLISRGWRLALVLLCWIQKKWDHCV